MTIKRLLTTLCLTAISLLGVRSQELVFEQPVDSIPGLGNYGPNLQHFRHFFFETALAIPYPQAETRLIRVPQSGSITLGYRYKLKVIRPIALVAEAGLTRSTWRLSQFQGKVFPDTMLHDRQSLQLQRAFAGVAVRLRFGQKGNYLGNYVDIGARENLLIGSRLVVVDPGSQEPDNWYNRKRQVFYGLDYLQRWVPELFVRVGIDRVSVTASYRPGLLFRGQVPVDMPKVTAGVEFALTGY